MRVGSGTIQFRRHARRAGIPLRWFEGVDVPRNGAAGRRRGSARSVWVCRRHIHHIIDVDADRVLKPAVQDGTTKQDLLVGWIWRNDDGDSRSRAGTVRETDRGGHWGGALLDEHHAGRWVQSNALFLNGQRATR